MNYKFPLAGLNEQRRAVNVAVSFATFTMVLRRICDDIHIDVVLERANFRQCGGNYVCHSLLFSAVECYTLLHYATKSKVSIDCTFTAITLHSRLAFAPSPL